MIKVFAGKDQYESYTKAKIEASKLAENVNASLKIINADEVDNLESFIQELEGVGMFTENAVFFIKRLSQNKKTENYFVENYHHLKSLDIVIWESINPDGRSKFTQMLKKEGVLFVYDESKEKDLKEWIINLLKIEEISTKPTLVDFILQNIEPNKFIIKNEIKKIGLYLKGKNKKDLTTEEISDILGFNVKGNIWKFLDYFSNRERKKCLNEYLKLTAFEDNIQYLIAMLERELSIISQVKYSEVNKIDPRELKLHPFVLQKAKSKARNFKSSEIKFYLAKLLNLDFAIKSGDIDEKLGMTIYLLSI